jgi:hypothetical protein
MMRVQVLAGLKVADAWVRFVFRRPGGDSEASWVPFVMRGGEVGGVVPASMCWVRFVMEDCREGRRERLSRGRTDRMVAWRVCTGETLIVARRWLLSPCRRRGRTKSRQARWPVAHMIEARRREYRRMRPGRRHDARAASGREPYR